MSGNSNVTDDGDDDGISEVSVTVESENCSKGKSIHLTEVAEVTSNVTKNENEIILNSNKKPKNYDHDKDQYKIDMPVPLFCCLTTNIAKNEDKTFSLDMKQTINDNRDEEHGNYRLKSPSRTQISENGDIKEKCDDKLKDVEMTEANQKNLDIINVDSTEINIDKIQQKETATYVRKEYDDKARLPLKVSVDTIKFWKKRTAFMLSSNNNLKSLELVADNILKKKIQNFPISIPEFHNCLRNDSKSDKKTDDTKEISPEWFVGFFEKHKHKFIIDKIGLIWDKEKCLISENIDLDEEDMENYNIDLTETGSSYLQGHDPTTYNSAMVLLCGGLSCKTTAHILSLDPTIIKYWRLHPTTYHKELCLLSQLQDGIEVEQTLKHLRHGNNKIDNVGDYVDNIILRHYHYLLPQKDDKTVTVHLIKQWIRCFATTRMAPHMKTDAAVRVSSKKLLTNKKNLTSKGIRRLAYSMTIKYAKRSSANRNFELPKIWVKHNCATAEWLVGFCRRSPGFFVWRNQVLLEGVYEKTPSVTQILSKAHNKKEDDIQVEDLIQPASEAPIPKTWNHKKVYTNIMELLSTGLSPEDVIAFLNQPETVIEQLLDINEFNLHWYDDLEFAEYVRTHNWLTDLEISDFAYLISKIRRMGAKNVPVTWGRNFRHRHNIPEGKRKTGEETNEQTTQNEEIDNTVIPKIGMKTFMTVCSRYPALFKEEIHIRNKNKALEMVAEKLSLNLTIKEMSEKVAAYVSRIKIRMYKIICSAIKEHGRDVVDEKMVLKQLPHWLRRIVTDCNLLQPAIEYCRQHRTQYGFDHNSEEKRALTIVAHELFVLYPDYDKFIQKLALKLQVDVTSAKRAWKLLSNSVTQRLLAHVENGDQIKEGRRVDMLTDDDWLVADLLMLYSRQINLMPMKGQLPTGQVFAYDTIFQLVCRYELESEAIEESTGTWYDVQYDYTKMGLKASVVLLQRRWFELKKLTRLSMLDYWRTNNRRNADGVPLVPLVPHPLCRRVAAKFQHVVVEPLASWDNFVLKGKITYNKEAYTVEQDDDETESAGWETGVTRSGSDSDDDDLILVEKDIETIDVDSFDEDVGDLVINKTNVKREQNIRDDTFNLNINIDNKKTTFTTPSEATSSSSYVSKINDLELNDVTKRIDDEKSNTEEALRVKPNATDNLLSVLKEIDPADVTTTVIFETDSDSDNGLRIDEDRIPNWNFNVTSGMNLEITPLHKRDNTTSNVAIEKKIYQDAEENLLNSMKVCKTTDNKTILEISPLTASSSYMSGLSSVFNEQSDKVFKTADNKVDLEIASSISSCFNSELGSVLQENTDVLSEIGSPQTQSLLKEISYKDKNSSDEESNQHQITRRWSVESANKVITKNKCNLKRKHSLQAARKKYNDDKKERPKLDEKLVMDTFVKIVKIDETRPWKLFSEGNTIDVNFLRTRKSRIDCAKSAQIINTMQRRFNQLSKRKQGKYNWKDLSCNPDFNIRLKRISRKLINKQGFLELICKCKPITVDLEELPHDTLITYRKREFKEEDTDFSGISSAKRSRKHSKWRPVKRVSLPDIEQVRRLNRSMLTAQVAPISQKTEASDGAPTTTSTQTDTGDENIDVEGVPEDDEDNLIIDEEMANDNTLICNEENVDNTETTMSAHEECMNDGIGGCNPAPTVQDLETLLNELKDISEVPQPKNFCCPARKAHEQQNLLLHTCRPCKCCCRHLVRHANTTRKQLRSLENALVNLRAHRKNLPLFGSDFSSEDDDSSDEDFQVDEEARPQTRKKPSGKKRKTTSLDMETDNLQSEKDSLESWFQEKERAATTYGFKPQQRFSEKPKKLSKSIPQKSESNKPSVHMHTNSLQNETTNIAKPTNNETDTAFSKINKKNQQLIANASTDKKNKFIIKKTVTVFSSNDKILETTKDMPSLKQIVEYDPHDEDYLEWKKERSLAGMLAVKYGLAKTKQKVKLNLKIDKPKTKQKKKLNLNITKPKKNNAENVITKPKNYNAEKVIAKPKNDNAENVITKPKNDNAEKVIAKPKNDNAKNEITKPKNDNAEKVAANHSFENCDKEKEENEIQTPNLLHQNLEPECLNEKQNEEEKTSTWDCSYKAPESEHLKELETVVLDSDSNDSIYNSGIQTESIDHSALTNTTTIPSNHSITVLQPNVLKKPKITIRSASVNKQSLLKNTTKSVDNSKTTTSGIDCTTFVNQTAIVPNIVQSQATTPMTTSGYNNPNTLLNPKVDFSYIMPVISENITAPIQTSVASNFLQYHANPIITSQHTTSANNHASSFKQQAVTSKNSTDLVIPNFINESNTVINPASPVYMANHIQRNQINESAIPLEVSPNSYSSGGIVQLQQEHNYFEPHTSSNKSASLSNTGAEVQPASKKDGKGNIFDAINQHQGNSILSQIVEAQKAICKEPHTLLKKSASSPNTGGEVQPASKKDGKVNFFDVINQHQGSSILSQIVEAQKTIREQDKMHLVIKHPSGTNMVIPLGMDAIANFQQQVQSINTGNLPPLAISEKTLASESSKEHDKLDDNSVTHMMQPSGEAEVLEEELNTSDFMPIITNVVSLQDSVVNEKKITSTSKTNKKCKKSVLKTVKQSKSKAVSVQDDPQPQKKYVYKKCSFPDSPFTLSSDGTKTSTVKMLPNFRELLVRTLSTSSAHVNAKDLVNYAVGDHPIILCADASLPLLYYDKENLIVTEKDIDCKEPTYFTVGPKNSIFHINFEDKDEEKQSTKTYESTSINKDDNTVNKSINDNKHDNTGSKSANDNQFENTINKSANNGEDENSVDKSAIDNKNDKTVKQAANYNKDGKTANQSSNDNEDEKIFIKSDNDNEDDNSVSKSAYDSKVENTVYKSPNDNKNNNTVEESTPHTAEIAVLQKIPQTRIKVKSFANMDYMPQDASKSNLLLEAGMSDLPQVAGVSSLPENAKSSPYPDHVYKDNNTYKKLSDDPIQYARVFTVVSKLETIRTLVLSESTLYCYNTQTGILAAIIRATAKKDKPSFGLNCANMTVVKELVEDLNKLAQKKPAVIAGYKMNRTEQLSNINTISMSGGVAKTPDIKFQNVQKSSPTKSLNFKDKSFIIIKNVKKQSNTSKNQSNTLNNSADCSNRQPIILNTLLKSPETARLLHISKKFTVKQSPDRNPKSLLKEPEENILTKDTHTVSLTEIASKSPPSELQISTPSSSKCLVNVQQEYKTVVIQSDSD